MFIVRWRRLSMIDVEDLVARIWCALAEHPVAAPRLSVQAHVDGAVDVGLSFRTNHDAELVMRAAPKVTCLASGPPTASWHAEGTRQN